MRANHIYNNFFLYISVTITNNIKNNPLTFENEYITVYYIITI